MFGDCLRNCPEIRGTENSGSGFPWNPEPEQLELEFSVPLISGKLRKHACLKNTVQREFNQNMCKRFLKDKIKIFKSFCSNLNMDVCVTLPVLRD